jgi:predicted TIM-barrel fold metal-dependent hydrolase
VKNYVANIRVFATERDHKCTIQWSSAFWYTENPVSEFYWNGFRSLANTVGIDRLFFGADYPYGSMKAARQLFDQMPINANDKEKIAHLNAERLLGLGQNDQSDRAPR